MTPEEQLEHLVGDASEVHSREELLEKLKLDRPLRIKYGADPSAPDLHLGHSVPMQRLRRFQELGHRVIFIIGDFTGRIGDPSGRSKTRPMLSEQEIERNAESFAQQAGKILDIDACEIRYNSEWLEPLGSDGIIKLAARYTVARMLERDDFARRMESETPISIVEFLYPLVQAYDSVAVEADVEVGGTDQLFNFLVGRDIMRAYGLQPQVAATWTLLVGTDGTEKMSKSLGNYVGITEPPEEMFGKLMSIPDDLLPHYYALLTDEGFEGAERIDHKLQSGELHPMEAKKRLARIVVTQYHGAGAAEAAQSEFEQVFSRGELPSQMPELPLRAADMEDGRVWIVTLVKASGSASSSSEARRLIRQGAVRLNNQRIEDETASVEVCDGDVLQVGKRTFAKIKTG
ncbi:MAG: tyrosine--tRNA ligase [Armatimonadota bacterium]